MKGVRAILRCACTAGVVLLAVGCGAEHVVTGPSPSIVPDSQWATVWCGGDSTLAIQRDGSLWGWGPNSGGELGLGDTSPRSNPTRVGDGSDWVTVASGYESTLALRRDGSLWAWGNNGQGQLGLGDTRYRLTPTRVGDASDWIAIACGFGPTIAEDYSLGLKRDGSIWAWGANAGGALGLGDGANRTTPTRIGSGNDWAAISCAGGSTVAVKKDGSLWGWGQNGEGQLGIPGGLDMPGSLDYLVPVRVGHANDWASVSCGFDFTLALKTDGSLWASGSNGSGQLGLGDTQPRWTFTRVPGSAVWAMMSCGKGSTLALQTDGSLWAWGDNSFGQLGLGDTGERKTPSKVGSGPGWTTVSCGARSAGVRRDGTLWQWGGGSPQPTQVGNK